MNNEIARAMKKLLEIPASVLHREWDEDNVTCPFCGFHYVKLETRAVAKDNPCCHGSFSEAKNIQEGILALLEAAPPSDETIIFWRALHRRIHQSGIGHSIGTRIKFYEKSQDG